jgi:hypothetical protein
MSRITRGTHRIVCFLVPLALLAPLASGATAGVCSIGRGAQLPDQADGYVSDASLTLAFESFRPLAPATVTSVCWWGLYDGCGPTRTDHFTIAYYADDGGMPGAIVAGPFEVMPNVKTETGLLVSGRNEFLYGADHPPVHLSDECTWISIVNDPDGVACIWFWETATPGDGTHVQDGTMLTDYDLAFSLGIDIEAAGCQLEGRFEPYCFGAAPAPCNCGNHGAPENGCANAVFPGGANLAGLTPGDPPNVANDEVELVASRMTPLSICLFLQAPDQVAGGLGLPFGNGLLCLRGSVRRLAVTGTWLGTARYPGPFDAPLSVRGAIPATGGTAYYQVLYRDASPFGPCGDESLAFNLTNGLRIDWE